MQNEWGAWNNYHFACNFAKCINRLYVSNIRWIWFIFLVYYGITTAEFGVLPQYILKTRTETCIFSSTLDASGSQRLENEWGDQYIAGSWNTGSRSGDRSHGCRVTHSIITCLVVQRGAENDESWRRRVSRHRRQNDRSQVQTVRR